MIISAILEPRTIANKDWATLLFLLCIILVAVLKSVFEKRFEEFLKLIVTNKYIKIYRDTSELLTWFNVFAFIIQLLSLSFFIQFLLSYFGYINPTNWLMFLRIFTYCMVFILSKFLIEKIVATAFDIEEFSEHIHLLKISYRSYISLLLLPVTIILFYNPDVPELVVNTVIGLVLFANLISYIVSINTYQNVIFNKIFYFILYLCALEIAPYYLIYFWLTKR